MHTGASPATEYHRTLITFDEGESNPSLVFHGYLVHSRERFFSLVNTNFASPPIICKVHDLQGHGRNWLVLWPRYLEKEPYDPTTATTMKTSLKNRIRILSNVFAIIPSHPIISKKRIRLELKRGDRVRLQTEIGKIIALSFSFSRKLKIGLFHV